MRISLAAMASVTVAARRRQDFLFDLEPGLHGIDAHTFAGQAGDVDVRSGLLVNEPAKDGGHLQPALVVDPG